MDRTSDNHFIAQSVHDLGAALWLGGAVMGIAGVNKSGRDLSQGRDRIRVAASAWGRFAPAQWAGIAGALLGGLRLTATSKRRLALQQGYGRVGALQAAFAVAGAGATGYAAYSGKKIAELAEAAERRGTPVQTADATIPAPETPAEIAAWQRRQRITQFAVPALAGATVVTNAWLVQSYRVGSTVKGVARRLLPG